VVRGSSHGVGGGSNEVGHFKLQATILASPFPAFFGNQC